MAMSDAAVMQLKYEDGYKKALADIYHRLGYRTREAELTVDIIMSYINDEIRVVSEEFKKDATAEVMDKLRTWIGDNS